MTGEVSLKEQRRLALLSRLEDELQGEDFDARWLYEEGRHLEALMHSGEAARIEREMEALQQRRKEAGR